MPSTEPEQSTKQAVVCSNCFKNHGLRSTAFHLGWESADACPSCDSTDGRKLDREVLKEVCWTFFVRGSIPTGHGVFAPLIQVNDSHAESDPFGTAELNTDIEHLRDKHGLFCFYYGPPLWMFGKPCDENGKVEWSVEDFDYIVDHCGEVTLTGSNTIYRVQLDLQETEISPLRFCSPPDEHRRKFWRFDSDAIQICYAAFDVETCLHESRVSLQNETYVVALEPKRALRFLDMTNCNGPAGVTRFEDPAIWLRALLYDGEESYDVCRRLAGRIREKGYDGFIYTSFFQQAAERPHKNVALFGTPIKSEDLTVVSINQVKVRNVAYDWQFGPVVLGAYLDDESDTATNP